MSNIDLGAGSLVALIGLARLNALLVQKGVITNDEAVTIYNDAVNMIDPSMRAAAADALKSILPTLKINGA